VGSSSEYIQLIGVKPYLLTECIWGWTHIY
jgi:hypothetical protein